MNSLHDGQPQIRVLRNVRVSNGVGYCRYRLFGLKECRQCGILVSVVMCYEFKVNAFG